MGIDCPEEDLPAAATSSDGIDADGVIEEEVPQEAIDATRERTPDVPGEPAVAETDFTDDASRHEYYAEFRAKVEALYLADARERWEQVKSGFQEEWRQYKKDHPAPPDTPPNVDPEARAEVERGCKGIRETEENIITPAMVRIEAEDPERWLVGFEFRCKGQERILEKVAVTFEEQPDLTPSDALASVKDAIRYTLQYTEEHYTEGVYADIDRLRAEGNELIDLRNSWASEGYKGINSRWRLLENEQLFEVQFHTQASFEAKQLTHQAYERIRGTSTTKAEQDVLADFQRRVNAYVPEPQRAREIPGFP